MGSFRLDLTLAVRALSRQPAFVLAAVLTLALAIGINTTVFTVLDDLLLHPLPFQDADRLVYLWQSDPRGEFLATPSHRQISAWKESAHSLEAVESFTSLNLTLSSVENPEAINGALIEPGLLNLLGVRPILGRPLDETPDSGRTVLLGNGIWKRHFGSNSGIVGKSIELNDQKHVVIGVLPAGFDFPFDRTQVWLPLPSDLDPGRGLNALGKLAKGASKASSEEELSDILKRQSLADQGWRARVVGPEQMLGTRFQNALWAFVAAVALVLVIACANVASLFLARGEHRKKQLAIRSALGATRFRLMRLVLAEGLTVALLAGSLGLLLSFWGVDLLKYLRPESLNQFSRVELNTNALFFALGVSMGTVLIFGLLPALQLSSGSSRDNFRSGNASNPTRGRFLQRQVLVALEIALSVILLIGAGLLVKSFLNAQRTDPGFDSNRVVALEVTLPEYRYTSEAARASFFAELLDRSRRLPGVDEATLATSLPSRSGIWFTDLAIEGKIEQDQSVSMLGAVWVRPEYFRLMGMRLLNGRTFHEEELSSDHKVMVVNRQWSLRFWNGEDPSGQRVRLKGETWQIVGEVNDVRSFGLTETSDRLHVYLPYSPESATRAHLLLKTHAEADALFPEFRTLLRDLDRSLPVSTPLNADEILARSISSERFNMALMSLFSALAMIMATVGVYGVVSFWVNQRTREFGVRMALGAGRRQILALVLGQGGRAVAAGLIIGLLISSQVAQLLSSMLFGVDPFDATVFAAVAILVTIVSVSACLLPSTRATRVNPLQALRCE